MEKISIKSYGGNHPHCEGGISKKITAKPLLIGTKFSARKLLFWPRKAVEKISIISYGENHPHCGGRISKKITTKPILIGTKFFFAHK